MRHFNIKGKKIALIDADLIDGGTRHPNLALMKISTYYKKLGNDVELVTSYFGLEEYDVISISCVFSFTEVPNFIYKYGKQKNGPKKGYQIGGTGFFPVDGGPDLPYEIEHEMPDYSLYDDYVQEKISNGGNRAKYSDYLDYSIGFATRGCFRKCEFCVNRKYDRVFTHSPLSEFVVEDRPKIYLWDDNIMASSEFSKIINKLNNTGKRFQFRQGLDIRLMTESKAKKLAEVKYSGDYIFAFDHIEDKELIIKKLEIWKKYCRKTTKLYVLTGYDSQDEVDIENTFERIKVLMEYGCLPYIMRYEDYLNSEYKSLYIQLARWCNQTAIFKKMSFRQFCIANQKYVKTEGYLCSSYKAMLGFEERFPEVADKYFDLRFEELNKFRRSNDEK